MVIREIVKEDLLSLNELFMKVLGYSSSFEKIKIAFEAMQNDESYKVLVAQIEEKIIAVVVGMICYNLVGDCEPYIRIENIVIEDTLDEASIKLLMIEEIGEIAKDNQIEKIVFNKEILFEEELINILQNKKCS